MMNELDDIIYQLKSCEVCSFFTLGSCTKFRFGLDINEFDLTDKTWKEIASVCPFYDPEFILVPFKEETEDE